MEENKKKSFWENSNIRSSIFIYFTVTAVVAILFIGITLYTRLSNELFTTMKEENQSLVNQVSRSVDSYIRTVIKLSDSLYYGVIKNADLSEDAINNEITLLYDNNKDNIENIALFSRDGKLMEAVPAARLKNNVDVTEEAWFQNALEKTDNIHFSQPQVQYVFDNMEGQYHWVISLSRAVELTQGPFTTQGVLLIDIRYTSFEQLFEDVSLGKGGYIYLINSDGEIVYHPRAQLIDAGRVKENNLAAAAYREGNHEETFLGENRMVTVKAVGYTGWKVVGVVPATGISFNSIKMKLFIVFIVGVILFFLALINSYISTRITTPIKELEKSLNAIEEGNLKAPVYIGGSYETRHLGRSIKNMAAQIQVLMDDIVAEHESKRKREFDTLQSQINPHFLYNTLDIIVWMIENEKKSEAVRVVTALARFFRISLSKGKSVIPVRDELEHIRNYLMIQQMRFKNKFTYEFETEEEVLELSSLKLMLQPLVENAIYHGMEFMDGDGEIKIKSWKEEDRLYFSISDNGLGMTEDCVRRILSEDSVSPSKRGSGIGVKNVNERIHLYFGEDYGLKIDSEPDEGTVITICLPVILYSEFLKKEENNVKE